MTFVTVKPTTRRRSNLNIDRWIDELFNTHAPVRRKVQTQTRSNGVAYPPVNVVELDDAFHIKFAAPGMEKGDFEIKVEKELLSISGKRETSTKEGATFRRKEFGNYNFKRQFQLSDTINVGAIEANYVNGILNVFVPKREESKEAPARKIEIA